MQKLVFNHIRGDPGNPCLSAFSAILTTDFTKKTPMGDRVKGSERSDYP
jgi:hypothetical protein